MQNKTRIKLIILKTKKGFELFFNLSISTQKTFTSLPKKEQFIKLKDLNQFRFYLDFLIIYLIIELFPLNN